MLKFYIILAAFLSLSLNAQTIQIPDPGFKNVLVNTLCVETTGNHLPDAPVDTNGDGEIQVEEALAVTHLIINDGAVLSMEGIKEFSNLEILWIASTAMTTLDISGMALLESLSCTNNSNLTSIDLASLSGLQTLFCSGNNLYEVDASQTSAYQFNFNGNPNLTSINLRNGVLTECLTLLEDGMDYTCAMFINLPLLQTVCLDDNEIEGYHSSAPQENVQFLTNCLVGLDDNTLASAIVYPNPASDFITISSKNGVIKTLTIYNILGQVVLSHLNTGNTKDIVLNLSSLQSGSYLLETVSDKGRSSQKIIRN